jgi:PAS domain S-box-containing protein
MIGKVGQRAQTYRELQTEQRKRILGAIGTALATNFNVNHLADILARELPHLGISRGYLALYENPQSYRYPHSPPPWSRLVLAYDQQNPAGSSRAELEPDRRRFPSRQLVPPEFLSQEGAYTLVVQALYFQNKQIGFMLLGGNQQDSDVFEMLRAQISSALQGALLVERVQENAAEIARQKYVLDTFMDSVPDTIYFKDRDSRITQVNRAFADRFGVDQSVNPVGKSDFDFFAEDVARPKYEQEQEIIRTGQPILGLEEPDAGDHWVLTTKMPLRDENNEIIGTFGISRDITDLKQAQQDLKLANQEISALNEQLKEENLRMSTELDVARRLQEMILPPPEELQQIQGLDIVGFMQPAAEVGGDYYDVLHKNGTTRIGIGDVTGHGLESGVLMLMTQTAIRTLIDHGETDPVKFVTTLNRTIYNNVRRAKMDKSLTFALVNCQDGQLKIVGQHEEMLLVKVDGRVELINTLDLGLPLGLEEEIAVWVDQAVLELVPGEGIVLYTDGITEAENDKGELYGLERLCEVVSSHWQNASAEAVKRAVVEDVTRYIGQQTVYDDLTLVVLKQE